MGTGTFILYQKGDGPISHFVFPDPRGDPDGIVNAREIEEARIDVEAMGGG